MKIGELAKAAHTQTETIRYYEREGLLPEASRTESNYRIYDNFHINRLAFIRHCRSLDMTLYEIRTLLHFKDEPTENCGEVNGLLDAHIGHVSTRIRELRILERELKALREKCAIGRNAADCGILCGLEKAARIESQAHSTGKHAGHIHGAHQQVGSSAKI